MNKVLSTGVIVSSVLFCLSSSHAMRIYNPNAQKKEVKPVKPTDVVKRDTKAKFPPLDAIANDEKALLDAVKVDAENFGRRLHNTTKAVLKLVPGVVFDELALKLGHIAIQRVFRLNEQRETDRSLISIGMMHEKGNDTTKKLIYNAYRLSINKVSYEKDIKLAVIAPDEASDSDDYKTKKYIYSKTKDELKAFDQLTVETAEPKRSTSAPATRIENVGMTSEVGQKAVKGHWDKVVSKGYDENKSDLSAKVRAESRSKSQERENARIGALKNNYQSGMEKEVMKYAKDLDVSEKTIVEQKEKLHHVGA